MNNFSVKKNKKLRIGLILFFFFLCHFLYFILLNRFHLWYFEQIQFFRFNNEYFLNFLSRPGGIVEYIGAFFLQFFYLPSLGALILTLLAISIFLISYIIFKKINFDNVLFSLLPIFLLVALQNNCHYSPAYTFCFVTVLGFFAVYISFKSRKVRYFIFPFSWILLFFFTGMYSFLFLVLCSLYELLYHYFSYLKWIILGYVFITFFFFYLFYRFVYKLPIHYFTLYPEVFQIQSIKLYLMILLTYFPIMFIVIFIIYRRSDSFSFSWNLKNILMGGFICIFSVYYSIFSYNKKEELIFEIDYYVQHQQWEKVLKTANIYPGINQLVIYFTNLALSQQGELVEKLFTYPQIGKKGLRLKWERNKVASFYGGEVFFYLQFNNEAFRWAFESIVSSGLYPRGLKRLIESSIANNHFSLADKYLKIMEESLFYHEWAKKKRDMLQQELQFSGNKFAPGTCCIHIDFTADIKGYDLRLIELLKNCPENKTALEYYFATLLFEKNIEGIWETVTRCYNYFRHKVPLPIEEALLIYMNNTGQRLNTSHLKIREETYQRFEEFARIFVQNPQNASQVLKKDFGNTFWYYFYFL